MKISDAVIAVSAFVTNALVIGYVLIKISINSQNNLAIVGLLVMLPRSMQIVMHLQIIQSYWAHWKHLKQKLSIVKDTVLRKPEKDIDSYITEKKITIKSETLQLSFEELQMAVQKKNGGRITIEGANGVGKSCLLLKIKMMELQNSVYIPAHHQLEIFAKEDLQRVLSTGEKLLKTIDSIIESKDYLILLDEWDANLSLENMNIINVAIEKLAQSKMVIEVRHRRNL